MAQLANILLNDGKATPVAHIFTPTRRADSSGRAVLNERLASGLAIGYPELWINSLTKPSFDGLNKTEIVLAMPQLEVISGSDAGYTPAPRVAYADKVNVTFYQPGRSTAANRKDLRVMLINALQNAIVIDAIENMAPAS